MDPPGRDLDGRGREPVSTNVTAQQSPPFQEPAEPYRSVGRSATRRSPPRPQTSSSLGKFEDETYAPPELHRDDAVRGVHGPLPPLPQARLAGTNRLPMLQPVDSRISGGPRSGIDWIVPVGDKVSAFTIPSAPHMTDFSFPQSPLRRTVGERLQPTLDTAIAEKNKYIVKARMAGYALNAAIGLQVIMGSLITGLSAVTTGKHASRALTMIPSLTYPNLCRRPSRPRSLVRFILQGD
jgi:SMODS and SLOG-associating 2TM effector domain